MDTPASTIRTGLQAHIDYRRTKVLDALERMDLTGWRSRPSVVCAIADDTGLARALVVGELEDLEGSVLERSEDRLRLLT